MENKHPEAFPAASGAGPPGFRQVRGQVGPGGERPKGVRSELGKKLSIPVRAERSLRLRLAGQWGAVFTAWRENRARFPECWFSRCGRGELGLPASHFLAGSNRQGTDSAPSGESRGSRSNLRASQPAA